MLPYLDNFKRKSSDVGTKVYAYGYPMALSIMGKEIKVTDNNTKKIILYVFSNSIFLDIFSANKTRSILFPIKNKIELSLAVPMLFSPINPHINSGK